MNYLIEKNFEVGKARIKIQNIAHEKEELFLGDGGHYGLVLKA